MNHQLFNRPDGLAHCKVCNGAESSLPTDCPGVQMTSEQQNAVTAETRDFIRGKWFRIERLPPPKPLEVIVSEEVVPLLEFLENPKAYLQKLDEPESRKSDYDVWAHHRAKHILEQLRIHFLQK